MRTIRLTTPQYRADTETKTEYEVSEISGIRSVVGDDDQQGTQFYVAGSFERQFCLEPARQLRQMIEDALNSEEVRLGIEAVTLLVRGVQSPDGALHFVEGDGFLCVVLADYKPDPFRGRTRSQYEYARDELVHQGFIVSKGRGLYQITQRGYAMGDQLAGGSLDKPFRGFVRLPVRPVEPAAPVSYVQNTYHQERSMNFNQTNNNAGDVNNAISEKGDVVQTVGGRGSTYNSGPDVAAALEALRPILADVAEAQRSAVETALDKLIEATRKDIPVAQVAPAVATVAAASPTLGQRLKEIACKMGLDLASSAILQALKAHFGL